MSKLGDILIKQTEFKMDFHQRQASGQAVKSLREVLTDESLTIYGIDYFENIFNGIPANTNVTLNDLLNWKSKKDPRYNINVIASNNTLEKILKGDAAINSQKERLHIDKQVVTENKGIIDIEVKALMAQNIEKWKPKF